VRRGITLATLLRAYRLGHAWLWDRWSQQLHERVRDGEEFVAAEQRSSAFMFAYIDLISDVLVAEYGSERERVMRSAEQLRAETVRAILAGEPLDGEAAGRRLGYELRRHHVALRVSGRGSELRGLERAAREAAAAVGAGDPLVVATGAATVDVWSGALGPPGPLTGLDAYVPPDGILVAVGTPGHGIEGFRRSHAEALQAARVAALARGGAAAVMRYERVELVTLLASDFARAGLRGHAARLARCFGRARRAPARDRARLPRRGRQRDAPGQAALRTPEHGCLPGQACRGAARPAHHG